MFRAIQILIVLVLAGGFVLAFMADSAQAQGIFQILLALVFIFGVVVWPFVNLQTQEIPEEDFQRDVERGL